MNEKNYGTLNAHTIGLTLKEIVRRAMAEVHSLRVDFEVTAKTASYKVDPADIFTTADTAAQKIYVKKLHECFPGFGIIAEEDELREPCMRTGPDMYFTIDPLDGTKAFKRRQSHGIGSMLSLVIDGEIVAAYVGDIMTGELYYYRPESDKVHRLNWRDERYEPLEIDPNIRLQDQYVQLRDHPVLHSEHVASITRPLKAGGLFLNTEVSGGSIGVWMARLWKGEVGAAVILSGGQTPWDATPCLGISTKLGFVFLGFDKAAGNWFFRDMRPSQKIVSWEGETLIIHRSRLQEFTQDMGQKLP